MKVAAALHVVQQHSQSICSQMLTEAHRAQTCRRHQQKKQLVGLDDVPVIRLVSRYRKPTVPSADHEGGSCPAHLEATSNEDACEQS